MLLSHVIIVLGAVGCYSSIFTLQIYYDSWIDVMTNLPDVQHVIDTSNSFDNTTIASVVIVCPRYSSYRFLVYVIIPPIHISSSYPLISIHPSSSFSSVLDSFLDFLQYLRSGKVKVDESSAIEHMSLYERLMFAAGMIVAISGRAPRAIALGYTDLLYNCTIGANMILCTCPIMLFLCRVNKRVWTGKRAFAVNLCIVLAALCQSTMNFYPLDTPEINNLFAASIFFIYFALALFLSNILLQWYRLYQKRMRRIRHLMHSDGSTDGGVTATRSLSSVHSDETDEEEHSINFDTTVAHTCNTFALLIMGAIWASVPNGDMNETAMVSFNIINIAVATCVVVVEMRVRKSEISHGLSQLDSKRAFVRYISHELRTPLSAAAMGLSLLEDDFDMEDKVDVMVEGTFIERHGEVLRMVQDSFTKAERICSDLLQYDKFENDNLPIVKVMDVKMWKILSDCMYVCMYVVFNIIANHPNLPSKPFNHS